MFWEFCCTSINLMSNITCDHKIGSVSSSVIQDQFCSAPLFEGISNSHGTKYDIEQVCVYRCPLLKSRFPSLGVNKMNFGHHRIAGLIKEVQGRKNST